MKKMMILLLIGALFSVLLIETVAAQDSNNVHSYFHEPFPIEFNQMVSTNRFPDIYPAAIYFCRSNNQVLFACVGLVFSDSTGKYSLIAPEHLFAKGVDFTYAIRIARPGNDKLLGYIDQIVAAGKDNNGLDMVIATIGSKPNIVKGYFFDKVATHPAFPASEVLIGDKVVKSIRSYITDKEVLILGYESFNKKEGRASSIIIETKAVSGYSGSPFYDEFGRFYIMQAALYPDCPSFKIVNDQFKEQFHRDMEGIAYLIGPFQLY